MASGAPEDEAGGPGAADDETIAFYDANAADYAAAATCAEGFEHLDRFIADLPAGAGVLDFGCGEGWAAGRLAAAGFDVLGMDASEGLLAIAGARPGVKVRRALFEDLNERRAYDGIWASFSLLHAPRASLPGHLARIARALRPGGRLYLGLKEGTGEQRDRLGRRYSYFMADEVSRHLRDAGFEAPSIDRVEGRGMTGDAEFFLHFHTRLAP
ncbi:MAG: class I SAM-dependent methyltransferase [Pseudomonadota bacterium]